MEKECITSKSVVSSQLKKQSQYLSLKEKSPSKQDQQLLNPKEILKKQQTQRTTSVANKRRDSLKLNLQINLRTSDLSKPYKKDLPQTKMSQCKVANITSNIDCKTTPIQQEKNKGNETIDLKVLQIQIKSSSDIPRFTKEIELLIKQNFLQYNLTIDLNFLGDKDFLNFCNVLIKIASKIRNLKWKIYGKFSSEDTSKQIGNVIGKCSTAFSINLNTGNTYFTDKSADSLALGLKKLSNLRILVLQINQNNHCNPKRITLEGTKKINRAIELLNKLEKVNYNGLAWDNFTVTPNQGNYVYQFESMFEYQGFHAKRCFKEKILPLKQQLIELCIRERQENSDAYDKKQYYEEYYVCYDVLQDVLQYIIRYSINNLPYLTFFKDPLDEITSDELFFYDSKPHLTTDRLRNLIKGLTLSRLQIVSIIIIYNKYIVSEQFLNPKVIFTDLFID